MKTTITFRHVQSSDALKDHVNAKLEKVEKYVNDPAEVHVVLSVEKGRHTAELILNAKGIQAQGTMTSGDMYTSIDGAVDKIEKTARRTHDKTVNRKKQINRPETGA